MVANNFFGCFKSWVIIWIDFEPCSSEASKSAWVSENNATSAPEIKAEHSSKIKTEAMPKISVVSMT